MRLTFFQLGRTVRGDRLDYVQRFGPANLDFAHVADIEETDGVPDRVVLLDDSRILHRHVPAAEIDHLRFHTPMNRVQGRSFEIGRGLAHETTPI
jgi:hypothetical protein